MGYLDHIAITSITKALITLLGSPATLTLVMGAPDRRIGG